VVAALAKHCEHRRHLDVQDRMFHSNTGGRQIIP
jgi:hypothetical protein